MNLERIAIEVVAGLLLVWGTVMYLEHRGAAQCLKDNAIAVAKQQARNAAQAADDTKTINFEAQAYAHTLAAPAPIDSPHVSVCYYKVPQASPARPITQPPDTLRSADPVPPIPGPDIGPSLVRVGRIADALAAQRLDYISRVCNSPP